VLGREDVQKFLSIIAGMVMGLLVVVGVGYVAIHWLFKSTTSVPTTAVSTPVSQSGNNSTQGGTSGAGSQSNTSQTGAGSDNTGVTSNTTAVAPAAVNNTGTGSTNATGTSTPPVTQAGQALSVAQQNAMATAIQALLQNPANEPVDCSAFVQYVYAKAGVKLPRTVARQAKTGTRITSQGQLQYGDIVFFNLSPQQNSVTFDGIYVGHGQFVARTTHKILSIGLNVAYWQKAFVYGQRVD
jgi:cell wall-associated NlpC family hydrolase